MANDTDRLQHLEETVATSLESVTTALSTLESKLEVASRITPELGTIKAAVSALSTGLDKVFVGEESLVVRVRRLEDAAHQRTEITKGTIAMITTLVATLITTAGLIIVALWK